MHDLDSIWYSATSATRPRDGLPNLTGCICLLLLAKKVNPRPPSRMTRTPGISIGLTEWNPQLSFRGCEAARGRRFWVGLILKTAPAASAPVKLCENACVRFWKNNDDKNKYSHSRVYRNSGYGIENADEILNIWYGGIYLFLQKYQHPNAAKTNNL